MLHAAATTAVLYASNACPQARRVPGSRQVSAASVQRGLPIGTLSASSSEWLHDWRYTGSDGLSPVPPVAARTHPLEPRRRARPGRRSCRARMTLDMRRLSSGWKRRAPLMAPPYHWAPCGRYLSPQNPRECLAGAEGWPQPAGADRKAIGTKPLQLPPSAALRPAPCSSEPRAWMCRACCSRTSMSGATLPIPCSASLRSRNRTNTSAGMALSSTRR